VVARHIHDLSHKSSRSKGLHRDARQRSQQLVQQGSLDMQGKKPLGLRAIVSAAATSLLTVSLGLQSASAAALAQITVQQPALAAFNGKLYLAFADTDGRLNVMSSTDGQNFGAPVVIPNNTSEDGPGLAAFDGRLYIAWAGTESRHRINFMTSTDGVTWGGKTLFGSEASAGNPALAASSTQLLIAYNGVNSAHNLNIACIVCTSLSFGTKMIYPIGSDFGVSITSSNDNFFVSLTRNVPATPVVVLSSPGGAPLTLTQQQDAGRSIVGPAMGSLNGVVYIGFPTSDSFQPLIVNAFQVSFTTLIPAGGRAFSDQSTKNIAIASFNGHLYLAWKANDNHLNIATIL
jgi:hypothetical protein